MKKIKLTPRLETVASFVQKCTVAADIGTDHGFVPTYLVQNGICERAIASDINQGPLQSAVRTAGEYGVSDKMSFICAPGLDGVEEGSADTVIIAGMGGETIVGILEDAPWIRESRTRLVLQPQSKLEYLDEYLVARKYYVEGAKLVKDAGRVYLVLSVRYSGSVGQFCSFYFTEYLKNDPLLKEYVTGILSKLSQRKQGLLSANKLRIDELDEIDFFIQHLNSLIREE